MQNLKITERFTRVAPNRLLYQFQAEDPTFWDKPWGGEYEFAQATGVYEYACHEGNYALVNALTAARLGRQSTKEADAKKQAEQEKKKAAAK